MIACLAESGQWGDGFLRLSWCLPLESLPGRCEPLTDTSGKRSGDEGKSERLDRLVLLPLVMLALQTPLLICRTPLAVLSDWVKLTAMTSLRTFLH